MKTYTKGELESAKLICDEIRRGYEQIRHVGFYDFLGKILYDSQRDQLVPLEGVEEMHILNGTVATTLALWKRSDHLIGESLAFIMIRKKIVGLIVPRTDDGSYFLAIFEKETPISVVEKVRRELSDAE